MIVHQEETVDAPVEPFNGIIQKKIEAITDPVCEKDQAPGKWPKKTKSP